MNVHISRAELNRLAARFSPQDTTVEVTRLEQGEADITISKAVFVTLSFKITLSGFSVTGGVLRAKLGKLPSLLAKFIEGSDVLGAYGISVSESHVRFDAGKYLPRGLSLTEVQAADDELRLTASIDPQ